MQVLPAAKVPDALGMTDAEFAKALWLNTRHRAARQLL